MSTPDAAIPAIARSHTPSREKTISCPPARMTSRASALTTKATLVMTIAPRAALIFVDPSFRQIVHVAADTPQRIAKRMVLLIRVEYIPEGGLDALEIAHTPRTRCS